MLLMDALELLGQVLGLLLPPGNLRLVGPERCSVFLLRPGQEGVGVLQAAAQAFHLHFAVPGDGFEGSPQLCLVLQAAAGPKAAFDDMDRSSQLLLSSEKATAEQNPQIFRQGKGSF